MFNAATIVRATALLLSAPRIADRHDRLTRRRIYGDIQDRVAVMRNQIKRCGPSGCSLGPTARCRDDAVRRAIAHQLRHHVVLLPRVAVVVANRDARHASEVVKGRRWVAALDVLIPAINFCVCLLQERHPQVRRIVASAKLAEGEIIAEGCETNGVIKLLKDKNLKMFDLELFSPTAI